MRLVVTGCTHMKHDRMEVPDGDVFIHTGDWCAGYASHLETCSVFDWVLALPHQHKLVVPGNHDPEPMIVDYVYQGGIEVLTGQEVVIDGVKFYGTPWTSMFGNWNWMKEEEDLIDDFDKIPCDTDVLITHGPPFMILDRNLEGQNCGSRALEARLQRDFTCLKHHVFSHIHEAAGVWPIAFYGLQFWNVSAVDRSLRLKNNPIVIDV